ncbi:hypothetical protein M1146_07665 [Patescibacteria group bacterium]|nr:hypothetical protein [Patescibacteria group bacterium]
MRGRIVDKIERKKIDLKVLTKKDSYSYFIVEISFFYLSQGEIAITGYLIY